MPSTSDIRIQEELVAQLQERQATERERIGSIMENYSAIVRKLYAEERKLWQMKRDKAGYLNRL